MTALEIFLLLIGLVLLVGSFFLTEKLTPSDMQKMAELSDEEMKKILDKRLEAAENRINEQIDDAIDGSIDKVERSLDRETNEKIMAIHEYSDTVMDEMTKTRDEITFLYSMLNDRHAEMIETTANLKDMLKTAADLKEPEEEPPLPAKEATPAEKPIVTEFPVPEQITELPGEGEEPKTAENHNRRILELASMGKSAVEIAKDLSLGVGEVQLVLGLSHRGKGEL